MNEHSLTQLAFEDEDHKTAAEMARRLGYSQTAYTSSSALIGLFCLPVSNAQKRGCIIKTDELGLLFVQCLEDLQMYDIEPVRPELTTYDHLTNKR